MNARWNRHVASRQRKVHLPRRTGVAAIWMLACLPVALAALQLVLEAGWMHRTRSELQVAVDSASLAGARIWGTNSPDAGSDSSAYRSAAKSAAQAVLAAHVLAGTSSLSSVSSNDGPGQVNNNQSCPGTILLGNFASGSFDAGAVPPTASQRACRCEITMNVSSPFGLGGRTFTATATAVWDSAATRAGLVTVTSSTCF